MSTTIENKKVSVYETEKMISEIKQEFATRLAANLNLIKVEAPLIVEQGTGINDDLNGIENPVSVKIKDLPAKKVEIVHSLAKWKRYKLKQIEASAEQGLYTDMRALRPDEDLSRIHSVYVDQWDWEKVIGIESRNLDYLKETVLKIYAAIKEVESILEKKYGIEAILPDNITFLHSEDVLADYPSLTSKERENEIAKKYGAVFLIGIGGKLSNGEAHDGRAPDYDDWSTPTSEKHKGLNGDILLWNPLLDSAFEVSSMGIRVNQEALENQLNISGESKRKELYWHQELLKGNLPQTIGGGIGQSRISMYLLRKKHIGEVQSSIWSEDIKAESKLNNINLL
ncbi:MAG: aspartate--ammonia ligase [Flavobacteriia bacterium]|jgi:aspartate--ammonia ligase